MSGRRVKAIGALKLVEEDEMPSNAVDHAIAMMKATMDTFTSAKLMSRLDYENFLELLRDEIVDRLLVVGEELDAEEADDLVGVDDGETP